ncbi:MAG: S41 family peptidase [bacterium]|nr:S41 family peptidase [bacterium]
MLSESSKKALKPLFYAMLLGIGVAIGMFIRGIQKDKFSQILDIISHDYVDSTHAIDIESESIDYLLSQLDPHSSYIPPELAEQSARQVSGKYEGLGIEYIVFKDTIFINNVHAGGPADKAGIVPGDRLLKANGKSLTDSLSTKKITEALQGEPNTNADLTMFRRNGNKLFNVSLERQTIVINSSTIYYMVNATLGYIKIDRFSGSSHKQFLEVLKTLKAQGMQALIVDLRNNGGGLLSEATAIANEFLEKDDLIAFTKGLHRKRTEYRANGNGIFKVGKLILLINHNTASASEILTGALQDNDRAVVMGNRSFGKGLVQEPYKLMDGSTLRLTIARYYTPSGRSIQKPYAGNINTYRNEIYTRNNLDDTIEPALDSNIVKTFFTRNGRVLTAGGGVRPDIILRDTTSDSTEIEMLLPGLFYSHVFDVYLLDAMSKELQFVKQNFKTIRIFDESYVVSETNIKHLIKLAKSLPYLRKLEYSKKTASVIRKHLKSAIANRIYGEIGNSMVINREEGIFSKSFEVLKKYNAILNIGKQKGSSFDY